MAKEKRKPKKKAATKKTENPLAQYDPTQPKYIPSQFTKGLNRSVYFPKEKSVLLYCANEMVEMLGGININEAIVEGLRLWIEDNKKKYLEIVRALAHREIHKLVYEHKQSEGAATVEDVQNLDINIQVRLKELCEHCQMLEGEIAKYSSDSVWPIVISQLCSIAENQMRKDDLLHALRQELSKRGDIQSSRLVQIRNILERLTD